MKKFLLVFAALAALVSCKNAAKDADSEYAVDMIKKGEAIPAFALKDRADVLHSPDEFAGKYVVYDFWATWCPDCRAETPQLLALQKSIQSRKDIVMVGISCDTDPEKLASYVKEQGITWLQLSDFKAKKDSPIYDTYRVKWIPTKYVIGPDGKILLATVVQDKVDAFVAKL